MSTLFEVCSCRWNVFQSGAGMAKEWGQGNHSMVARAGTRAWGESRIRRSVVSLCETVEWDLIPLLAPSRSCIYALDSGVRGIQRGIHSRPLRLVFDTAALRDVAGLFAFISVH